MKKDNKMFGYKKNARERALYDCYSAIMASLIFAVIGIIFMPTIIVPIICGLIVFCFILMMSKSLVMLAIGGEWNIQITDSEVIWDTPKLAEQPFRILLTDISHIEKSITYKKKPAKNGRKKIDKTNYSIVKNDSSHWALAKNSGIDIQEFLDKLKERGIKEVEKHI